MNYVSSIKEMLNMPNGNSYSSLTESELFFGSQFWHENSQGNSEDMTLSFKSSQQSSQEGSDPKFISNYHTKPLLFGDLKDETKISGLLDKFEEDRKKVEEKKYSDLLAKELQHIRETLVNIQQLMADTEKNVVSLKAFEKIDNFSSTLKNCLKSLQDDISQKFDTLVDKVNSHEKLMAALQERVQDMNNNGGTTAQLDSHFKSSKSDLEHLKEEQERQNHVLEEALKHLSAVLSEHSNKRSAERVMDSAIQTSPELKQSVSDSQQVSQLEATPLTHASYNLQQHQDGAPPKNPSHVFRKRKLSLKSYRRCKKRPLVFPQTSKSTVLDKNSRPATHHNKPHTLSTPLRERCDQNKETKQYEHSSGSVTSPNMGSKSAKALGCFTPLNYWSQDNSSPECLTLIEPILEKLADKPTTPVKPGNLWQLFDSDFDF